MPALEIVRLSSETNRSGDLREMFKCGSEEGYLGRVQTCMQALKKLTYQEVVLFTILTFIGKFDSLPFLQE